MAKPKQVPRGIRNNNPLNIRIGNVWMGEVMCPTDLEFEQFMSMEYGIRAAFVILRRYIRHYHLDTVQQIVSRWAPRSENQTDSYIATVCQQMGIEKDTPIKYEDRETMYKLVEAMSLVECGQKVPMSKIEKGYALA